MESLPTMPLNAPKTEATGQVVGEQPTTSLARFGTFKGVFIPNITMMFGVILFLRLGMITAYVGTFWMSAIIVAAAVIMLLTSFSITSIVTNMRVGGGGVYYLISRSLGLELGGAIGIILYLSQIISIALCTIGFSYSLRELLPFVPIELIELCTLSALALLSFFSADWALKTQTVIFGLILLAVVSVFFTAQQLDPSPAGPLYFPQGLGFWAAFSMFFPAMTGIEAGMAMSGSLKNPSRALSLGNIFSVLLAFAVYLSLALFTYHVIPSASLQRDPMVLLQYVRWPAVIYIGIWAATLSSVLGGILGAPRMLQTIAEDGIVPGFLAKTYGVHKEPRVAILVTFALALVVMFCTSMDQIIPILAMVRLITYGLLNLVATFCELINSPSWRPKVRVPWYVGACGAASCFFVMFMIDPGWTFTALFLVALGYMILAKRQMEAAFRDIRSSILFYFSRLGLYRLAAVQENSSLSHWHPQLLAFTQTPQNQEKMVYLCHELTKQSGILTFAAIVPREWSSQGRIEPIKKTLKEYYTKHRFACLVEALDAAQRYEGMQAMIKTYGVGPIYPNTIVMGMPQPQALNEGFYELTTVAKECKKNLILFHDGGRWAVELYRSPRLGAQHRIDIWWDASHRSCFELMLSYLKILTDSRVWKGSRVCLKAVVHSERAQENLQRHFAAYLADHRLNYSCEVYVEAAQTPYWDTMVKHSSDAHLVFMAMQPVQMFASREAYAAYYEQLSRVLQVLPPTLLISWYDGLEHKKMYQAHEAL